MEATILDELVVEPACRAWTPEQLTMLEVLSHGARVSDAARQLGISHERARSVAATCQRKLRAHNQAQAVLTALRIDLIR